MSRQNRKVRVLAFYLPQFHPIPENDEWWGKGFTEWRSVVKARPAFKGHYQPHLPADLGFYDLRLSEAREAQAGLARDYGIHGFVYYHYWFNGRLLLNRPFDEVLELGRPELPFCLCWANENWTRAWDGQQRHVLLEQHYSEIDDRQHVQWLAKAFQDTRYIRIGGKPLFMVYRASKLPNANRTVEIWREEAHKSGIGELYLVCVQSFVEEHGDPTNVGFDAAVEFQPDWRNLGPPTNGRILSYLTAKAGLSLGSRQRNSVFDYSSVVEKMLAKPSPRYTLFRCVMPSWDNTPRRPKGAHIFANSTPSAYESWLRNVISRFDPPSPEEDFVFINAWNEWGEGCHLEPCLRWGHGYLQATRNALSAANGTEPK